MAFLRETRLKMQKHMGRSTTPTIALCCLRLLEHPIAQMALGKTVTLKKFELGVSGSVSKEKLETMRINWIKHLQASREPFNDLAAATGMEMPDDGNDEPTMLAEVCFYNEPFTTCLNSFQHFNSCFLGRKPNQHKTIMFGRAGA